MRADAPEQATEAARSECDAAGSRPKSGAREVKKNRAAATRDPRPRVVVEFDEEIVEVIVAPQTVARRIGREPDRPVIPAVVRIFAPGVRDADAAQRQTRARAGCTVGAPPEPDEPKRALRSRAVALALVGANAGRPQGSADVQRAGFEPCFRPAA